MQNHFSSGQPPLSYNHPVWLWMSFCMMENQEPKCAWVDQRSYSSTFSLWHRLPSGEWHCMQSHGRKGTVLKTVFQGQYNLFKNNSPYKLVQLPSHFFFLQTTKHSSLWNIMWTKGGKECTRDNLSLKFEGIDDLSCKFIYIQPDPALIHEEMSYYCVTVTVLD